MRIYIFTLFFFFPFFGTGQLPLESIVAKAKTIETLSAKFTQTKHNALLSEAQKSDGVLLYSAPNALVWEQQNPSKFAMLFIDNTVKIKENDSPTQTINSNAHKMFRELRNIIIGGISGTIFSDTKNYNIESESTDIGFYVRFVPKSIAMKKYLSHFSIQLNAEFLASSIELVEKNGNTTKIQFSHIQLNKTIDKKKFTL